jgi:rhombotail lipoprotein
MMRKPWWLAVVLGLSGCVMTSGFNRDLMESRLREGVKVTDDEIKHIQTLKPQLHFPCRIAVALKAGCGDWRFSAKDRQVMELWANDLRKEGIASDVILMADLFMPGDTLMELRASAAKYGADARLVVKGTSVTASYLNPAALFNLTVVGGFVVPGSHRHALFLMEGGLVDVNNGFLYASMEAEGEGHTLAPTFIIEERDAIERAKQEALTSFGPELLLRLRNLRASCMPAPEPVAQREQARP